MWRRGGEEGRENQLTLREIDALAQRKRVLAAQRIRHFELNGYSEWLWGTTWRLARQFSAVVGCELGECGGGTQHGVGEGEGTGRRRVAQEEE